MAKDEAILVAAMVGSVGTFGAVSMPWDAVLNGVNLVGGQPALVTELDQIEKANTEFYRTYNRWPYEMTNGSWAHNAAALVTKQALRYPFSYMDKYDSLLTNVAYNVSANGVALRHAYGKGGRILQRPVTEASPYHMEVVFEDVPLSTAKVVDTQVDGGYDPDHGRVRMEFENGKVHLIYRANSSKS